MSATPERIEAEFRRLALEAGKAIMEVYRAPDFETRAKADSSPVTDADLAADRIIAEGLRAAFPEIPLVTEEQAATHAATGHARFFLVDPLDGTKEFVQRRGEFTVNIALIEGGRPVMGVVHAPAVGRMFRSLAGGGAAEEAVDEAGTPVPGSMRPIAVATPDPAALSVVASKSHRDKATDDYIARFAVAAFKSAGSSLKFCLLAAGEADLYPRLGRTMEWDTAAGHAVLSAAGGEVLRFDDQSPLLYGKTGYENPFFIARVPGVQL
ncbi:3'(2'),5'-bisphosphate nucleotidase CysQ [Limibaculum sp. M0105]|uniref:3'(2'),5'-bisphosphate nucleotidase CysQ n=1 Tax=Thermohalobaculum xanthum TaxID=2753746 RepID=A0A8J7M5Z0_9RHOB|nr:3'(2'),5'-bisphosphate nucleotidase CysQ [Thermohalobaculum xanthum]MBK0398094.1 3'(2'),5'-bisphosphate nucleotidase CysQ [Thermohalobaculum xanthum]